MTWGAEDLSTAVGASTNRDESGEYDFTYKLARSTCLLAAHAAGVQAIDTITADFRDGDRLVREVRESRRAGFTGKGVTVAVVDTGVDLMHPDLAGSFRGGAGDWFDVHGEQPRPGDRHGHGSQITGLVTGTGASGQTLGVAPQAKWIAARIYNDRNVGRLSQLHRIMGWLLDPDGKPGTADAPGCRRAVHCVPR